jgi:hypothetical protein
MFVPTKYYAVVANLSLNLLQNNRNMVIFMVVSVFMIIKKKYTNVFGIEQLSNIQITGIKYVVLKLLL